MALLKRLVVANVTCSKYSAKLRAGKQKPIAEQDRSEFVYVINKSTVVATRSARAADKLGDFLQWDTADIVAEADSLRFLEFKNIKLTNRIRC